MALKLDLMFGENDPEFIARDSYPRHNCCSFFFLAKV